ncbi:hypothetical protein QR680_000502 [Steinernema hermaphroditum]|uniref:Uncharacterized protein n=1 Tax=Steinernema hermaphroditum TaxID=289476 RepID=A0AA39LE77_9BILA|nr:hypothetical protein QR680_000502 [Steinernema hermaphroditum]
MSKFVLTVLVVLTIAGCRAIERDECWEDNVEALINNCDGRSLPCVKGGRLDGVPADLIPRVTRCCGEVCAVEVFRAC